MPVDSADDLYGLPLEQFIPERTALVKQLKADQEKDEATRVAALKKPSVAAWAVNQIVRTQKAETQRLFEAGDTLADSGDAEGLKQATKDVRDALAALTQKAHGLLSSDGAGLGAQTIERVTETLRAAALDPEAREQVADGCLTKELQFAGFGFGSLPPAPPPPPGTQSDAEPEPQPGPEAEDDEEAELRRAAIDEAQQAVADAVQALKRAREAIEAADAERVAASKALLAANERTVAAKAAEETAATGLAAAVAKLSELREPE